MRSLKNKLIIKRESGEELEISIGSLYILLRDYHSQNTSDFDGMDILVVMPVAADNSYVWFCCMVISTESSLHVSGNKGKDLIVIQDNDRKGEQNTIQIHPDELLSIIQKMPARGQYTLMMGECEVMVYFMSMQCSLSDLIFMPLVPIDLKLTDLRQWPKDAICLWARRHLKLSQEQLRVMNDFVERWKMVNYAQEVFTYHCGDFNPDAKKKIDKINKALKEERTAKMVEIVANDFGKGHPKHNNLDRGARNPLFHADDDYIINLGKMGLLCAYVREYGEVARDSLELYYEDRSSKNVYQIQLVKQPSKSSMSGFELVCYVNGVQHSIAIGNSEIQDSELCILGIDDMHLHISLERYDDSEPWHAPNEPVDPEQRYGYDLKRNNPNPVGTVRSKNQSFRHSDGKPYRPNTETPEEPPADPHESAKWDPQARHYERFCKTEIKIPEMQRDGVHDEHPVDLRSCTKLEVDEMLKRAAEAPRNPHDLHKPVKCSTQPTKYRQSSKEEMMERQNKSQRFRIKREVIDEMFEPAVGVERNTRDPHGFMNGVGKALCGTAVGVIPGKTEIGTTRAAAGGTHAEKAKETSDELKRLLDKQNYEARHKIKIDPDIEVRLSEEGRYDDEDE